MSVLSLPGLVNPTFGNERPAQGSAGHLGDLTVRQTIFYPTRVPALYGLLPIVLGGTPTPGGPAAAAPLRH